MNSAMLNASIPLAARIEAAKARYGAFASTHEALGVALEEWDELRAAVHANKSESVREECLDLAAVLLRLHEQLGSDQAMQERSRK